MIDRARHALVFVACLAACASPGAVPPGRRAGTQPTVRIALAPRTPRAVIGAQGSAVATADGRTQFRVQEGASVVLTAEGRTVRASGAASGLYERLTFASVSPGRHVTVGGDPWRGTVEVWAVEGAIRVVNVVRLEDYLAGVVSVEMGPRPAGDAAALEAQAIVSRTYALRNAGRFGADGYDLQRGVADQAYGGVGRETEIIRDAVRRTAGRVLTYGGELITPFFSSTCGGRTASPVEAFRSVADQPYLRSVSDRRGDGAWCDISPRYRWSVTWDATALRAILARTVPATVGVDADVVRNIEDVYVRRTGPSGRALEVRIRVASGEIPVFAPDVRTVLAPPEGGILGGSLVTLSRTSGGGLVADGHGWGHGVGLCQWGAIGRARAGQSAEAILRTYFPGVDVARWY